ncbi:helix-turn-helix transcriptional regulator [Streptosporangium sp. NPDC051023]|uniref:helix-turn-helix domain-containing protein n=1 Tax=Streptosporangium sp. NPDC051023 TaxID=3155410 RepID=UPI00344FCB8F
MKSPTVRHRRLGRELRQLRERAGLSVAETARRLGWSASKAHRIEGGRIMLSEADLVAACDLFGADSATRASLVQLARDAGRRGWWTAYSDVFTGSYIALEAEATVIRKWEPLLIPGLLQSEDYAREIIRSGRPDLSASEVDRRVDARMTRKVRLLGASAPKLHALIDENALRRLVGGPKVMARQLADILQVVDWSNITIQILPIQADIAVGLEGAFSLMSFEEDPDVGYVEGPAGEVYVEAADQVRRFMLTFERLADKALSPKESAALIAAVRSNHDLS